MARIRTIKPEFFRNEQLQDLQIEHPELNPMLVFSGLWTLCDKAGRFEWKPRSIKLDILPFLDYDLGASLMLLREAGLIKQYKIGEKLYGLVVNFETHQRISGKEAQEPSKYPEPIEFVNGNNDIDKGSIREALEKHPVAQEGKGKEREREKEGKGILPREVRTHKKNSDTQISENFTISDSIRDWYRKQQYTEDIDRHFVSFVDKCRMKKYAYADWDAALRNAIREDWAKLRKANSNHAQPDYEYRPTAFSKILGTNFDAIEGELA